QWAAQDERSVRSRTVVGRTRKNVQGRVTTSIRVDPEHDAGVRCGPAVSGHSVKGRAAQRKRGGRIAVGHSAAKLMQVRVARAVGVEAEDRSEMIRAARGRRSVKG